MTTLKSNLTNPVTSVSTTIPEISTISNQNTTGGTSGTLYSKPIFVTSSPFSTLSYSTNATSTMTNESNCLRILYEDIGTSK